MKFNGEEDFTTIMIYATEEAIRTGCVELRVEHIILGAIRQERNSVYNFFKENNLPINYIKKKLNEYCDKGRFLTEDEQTHLHPSPELEEIGRIIPDLERINILTLIKYAVRLQNTYFAELMNSLNITAESFSFEKNDDEEKKRDAKVLFSDYEIDYEDEEFRLESENNILDTFGFDLTEAAEKGELDPVIGRESEIQRVLQILGRRKKNNPLLIGEAGVGKSSIAEAIAMKIVKKEVPFNLLDKRIISLDLVAMVAGTKFRGEFESRIKSILEEVKSNPDIILLIDELHTIVGAGNAQGTLDAADMLKPALSRGEFQCIGTTTIDEYRNVIEKDSTLERRFQKVMIEAPTKEETYYILSSIKEKYEKYHRVKYTEEALKACIDLSVRYISERNLPDKAIDIMDEAGSKKHLHNADIPDSIIKLKRKLNSIKKKKIATAVKGDIEETSQLREEEKKLQQKFDTEKEKVKKSYLNKIRRVTEQDICKVMSEATGIPLNKIAMSEGNRLLTMAKTLSKKVIGQDEAIEQLSQAIKRNRAGLNDPNKPIGTFLFLGPTGVGKTYLAKKLAEFLFDREDTLIRIDMSEYMEKHSVSRLIGAPPGYVGYDEGGELSEKVRHKPYCVVLLDEVEKAHPDIFNLLLQVLDEGRLTDSNGRYINFKNTVLILTSNIGSRELLDFGEGIGYNIDKDGINKKKRDKSILDKALKRSFSPEFINRLDGVIQFRNLDKNDIEKIVRLELQTLQKRLKESGYEMSATKDAVEFLANTTYDAKYGARPVKRAIQHNVEKIISDTILAGLKKGSRITVKYNREKHCLFTETIFPQATHP